MPRSSGAPTSPSMRQLTQCSLLTAAWTLGKRSVQSVPCLVSSRIRAASRWANNRHPSILISCSHPPPAGGLSAWDGRHGMKPAGRAIRERNDMPLDIVCRLAVRKVRGGPPLYFPSVPYSAWRDPTVGRAGPRAACAKATSSQEMDGTKDSGT